jgi:hypothetical protein
MTIWWRSMGELTAAKQLVDQYALPGVSVDTVDLLLLLAAVLRIKERAPEDAEELAQHIERSAQEIDPRRFAGSADAWSAKMDAVRFRRARRSHE